MTFTKQGPFTKKVTDLPNTPSPSYTPADIKSYFQTPADELAATHNQFVDELEASTGAIGIGAKHIDGTPSTIQTLLDKRGNDLTTHKTAVELDHPDQSVTTSKLKDKAVTSGKIGDSEVKTGNIENLSVTNEKLAGNITGDKIATKQIGREHVKSGAIGLNELDPSIISQPGDGIAEQAKFASIDAQLADNTKKAPWVSIEQFGAVGDWNGTSGTDNTQAIKDAISAVSTGGKVIIPNKKFRFTSQISIPPYVTLEGQGVSSELVFDGLRSEKYAVVVQTSSSLKNLVITFSSSTWDLLNKISGIALIDCSQVFVDDVIVQNFEIGIYLLGESKGCTYNQIKPRMILDCHIPIYLEAKTTSGWNAENSFYGGRLTISGSRRVDDSYGIYLKNNGSNNPPNSNKFYGQSVEGFGKGIHIEGRYNSVFSPRFEFISTGVNVEFKETNVKAEFNTIINAYGYLTLGSNVKQITVGETELSYLTDNFIIGRGGLFLNEGGFAFHSYKDVNMKYNGTLDQIIFRRGDLNKDFFGVGRNSIDFYSTPTKNMRLPSGDTASRPSAAYVGNVYFDTTLGKPIFATGSKWVDSTGANA